MTATTSGWNRQAWERAVSARCWWYTPYDAGWNGCKEHGRDLAADAELRDIVRMERELGHVPAWARAVVERNINYLPPCGHCHFPLAFTDVVDLIGRERAPDFVHTCYTANRDRKERAQDYLFCLDAWVAGARAGDAARELAIRTRPGPDWPRLCHDLWQVLGERTELKELLVERTLHRYRWWVKTLAWDDDARDAFGRDMYLGDVRGSRDAYGNPDFLDPYFVEPQTPRVQRLEKRIAALTADWGFFKDCVDDSWLCAPKTFRFLERNLWGIGKQRSCLPDEAVPGFLQCEDTYPRRDEAVRWWREFTAALAAWWQGEPPVGQIAADAAGRLAAHTPVKQWLVRLYVHKLRHLEMNTRDGLAKLVVPDPDCGVE